MNARHNNYSNRSSGMNSCCGFATALAMVVIVAMLLFLSTGSAWGHSHDKSHGDEKTGGMKMSSGMKMGGCEREIHLSENAEMQMGGAHFKGSIAKKAGMKGMNMSGGNKAMKMGDGGKSTKKMSGGMKMPAAAHDDHDAKTGGVLFMAPNEMHHVEGAFSPKCGFQLFIYNAFTKPIRTDRFHAFIKVSGESEGEEVEFVRFLLPNHEGSVLQSLLKHGVKPPFEVELNVRFPEGDEVEVFNFAVDEHGKMS